MIEGIVIINNNSNNISYKVDNLYCTLVVPVYKYENAKSNFLSEPVKND